MDFLIGFCQHCQVSDGDQHHQSIIANYIVHGIIYQYLCKHINGFQAMTDLEKVNSIRKWLSEKLRFVHANGKKEGATYQDHHQYNSMESVDIIKNLAVNENCPYMYCGGVNTILMQIYKELNIPVVTLNIGFRDTIYTHFVTLVEVNQKLYLQDAWYNTTWLSTHGEYLSLDQILDYLENHEPEKIKLSPEYNCDPSITSSIEDLLKKEGLPSNQHYSLYYILEINPVSKPFVDYANGDLQRLISIGKLNTRVFNFSDSSGFSVNE